MCSDRPLLSVIVPAYNAGATLGRALVSTPRSGDVEVVVVNDGSNDNTLAVACEAADTYNNIRIVDLKKNGGLASASAAGIDAARGVFVTRLDADDTLEPLDSILRLLSDDVDVVWTCLKRIEKGKIYGILPPADFNLNSLPVNVSSFSMCAKFIRRSLLTSDGMRAFPGLDCWEDLGVTARLLAQKPRIVRTEEASYNYFIAPAGASLSTSRRERLLHDHIAIARLLDAWMAERSLQETYRIFLDHLKFAAKVKYLRGRGRQVRKWKDTFPEINSRILSLSHVAFHHRLLFAVVAALPAGLSQKLSDFVDRFNH